MLLRTWKIYKIDLIIVRIKYLWIGIYILAVSGFQISFGCRAISRGTLGTEECPIRATFKALINWLYEQANG